MSETEKNHNDLSDAIESPLSPQLAARVLELIKTSVQKIDILVIQYLTGAGDEGSLTVLDTSSHWQGTLVYEDGLKVRIPPNSFEVNRTSRPVYLTVTSAEQIALFEDQKTHIAKAPSLAKRTDFGSETLDKMCFLLTFQAAITESTIKVKEDTGLDTTLMLIFKTSTNFSDLIEAAANYSAPLKLQPLGSSAHQPYTLFLDEMIKGEIAKMIDEKLAKAYSATKNFTIGAIYLERDKITISNAFKN